MRANCYESENGNLLPLSHISLPILMFSLVVTDRYNSRQCEAVLCKENSNVSLSCNFLPSFYVMYLPSHLPTPLLQPHFHFLSPSPPPPCYWWQLRRANFCQNHSISLFYGLRKFWHRSFHRLPMLLTSSDRANTSSLRRSSS